MWKHTAVTKLPFVLVFLFLLLSPTQAQQGESTWDVTQPRGQTRTIDFATTEGTWMSVDISPDGKWIVFDLLAHIYRVPATGGEAECLTQNSGVALNFHPRYSPDGKSIAFVSDRQGQNNLWLMEAGGKNPRPVFTDPNVRVAEPVWTPDGQYIVARRLDVGKPGFGALTGLWMYHREGGEGVSLIGPEKKTTGWPDLRSVGSPSVSADGKYLYFDASLCADAPAGGNDVVKGCYQIRRLESRTGEIIDVTAGQAEQQYRGSSGGAIAPEVSPDGRWLAFARRIPGGTISYKGQQFGPRTALWLRDLQNGAERVLMDPIETDAAEGFYTLRILPGYAWARDAKSLVLSQGGKIRRVWVESGEVETVPFSARVHRVISEMAYAPFRISDGPFEARFLRWPTVSPDGRKLVFQAVGKLWMMDLPGGTPRRLTAEAFQPFEFAPAWSPDGQWVAFTSWADSDRGHLWKVAARGGEPQRLTMEAGEYLHPVWRPDGGELVMTRGSGATAHGQPWSSNPWYELVRVPSAGGPAQPVARTANALGILGARRQIARASFGPEGRIFFPALVIEQREDEEQWVTELVSVRPDGSDKRVHLKFPHADEVVVSPDGQWVAFQESDNVYLMPFPPAGAGSAPPLVEKKKGQFPVRQLSQQGGLFPRWWDARTVEFGSGHRHFAYQVDTEQTDTREVHLSVSRALPTGSVALTGARIVTLENRRVIEQGTIVVKGARIACVGTCDTRGVDRVIDIRGKTIIPGFIDLHAHHHRDHQGVNPARDYERAIYVVYGVTTTLDNSMWSQNVFPTAELVEAGRVIGPRLFSTGDPLYRGDGLRWNDLTSYEVADHNVARLASWGAVSIKQYHQPRREQRQWVTDSARRRHVMVTAEGGGLEYNLSLIMDGHTGFEHPMGYAPLYNDVANFFGRAKIVYSPTLVVGGPGPWNEEYFFQESDLWKDEKLRRWTPWRQLMPHTRRRLLRPATDYSYPFVAQGVADIIAQGGYGAIGSHGQQHGLASHWEVWMLAAALGPMGALEVASLHGARFIGVEQDTGTLAMGKLADLMVLNSNPLENIRHTADMLYVMKAGRLYEAATLDEVWPDPKPFGPYYWTNPDALKSDDRPVNYWDQPRKSQP